MSDNHTRHEPGRMGLPQNLLLWGFLAILLFFLLTEHRAHLFGVLPYLLVLACPLMHVFMHRNHGSHKHGHGRKEDEP